MNNDFLKMSKEEKYQMVEDYVKTQEQVSISLIQHVFNFSFVTVRDIFEKLLANEVIYLNAPDDRHYIVKK